MAFLGTSAFMPPKVFSVPLPPSYLSLQNTQGTAAIQPIRLTIPSIGVDAPVIQAGLTADGSVGVPKGPVEVAWFNAGPLPGQMGSAILTGHYGPWRNGSGSVFDDLHKITIGQRVQVTDASGKTLTFRVIQKKIYSATDTVPEVFTKADGKYLNLITCNGEWLANQQTYNRRLVVFTQLEE